MPMLNECFKGFFSLKMSQVMSKAKIVAFCLISLRGEACHSCEPKLFQKAFQWMKKVAYKYVPHAY